MRRPPTADDLGSRGSILIWALLFVVVVAGMIISHSIFLTSKRREQEVRYNQEGLAATFARSGLVDAVGWFRRQGTQPVVRFDPQLAPTGDPPLFDTIDPVVGLVREFEIRGSLWGRYEVRHADAHDVSARRGLRAPGSTWEVGVHGFVYRVVDPRKRFDEPPNRVIATTAMTGELRGIQINPPAPAALSLPQPDLLVLGPNSSIEGGDRPALVYDATTAPGGPINDLVGLDGSPPTTGLADYDAEPSKAFGMRLDELQEYSDVVVRTGDTGAAELVHDYDKQTVTIVGNLTSVGGIQMRDGLLVVRGDLTTLSGTDSDLRGVVYVEGDVLAQGDLRVRGTVIVQGAFHVVGTPEVRVAYDAAAIESVKSRMSAYRLPRSLRPK
jgi:hypothetical protein